MHAGCADKIKIAGTGILRQRAANCGDKKQNSPDDCSAPSHGVDQAL
jgi:hypothetical protein